MVNRSSIKIGALTIAAAVAAAVLSYSFSAFNNTADLSYLWPAAVAVPFFLAFFTLTTFSVENKLPALVIILTLVLALAISLYNRLSFVIAVSLALVFLVLLWSYGRGRSSIENGLTLRFFNMARPVSHTASTAVAIFITFLYIGLINLQNLTLTNESFNALIKPTEPFIEQSVAGFSFGWTIKEFAKEFLKSGAATAILPPDIAEVVKKVPAELQGEFLEKTSGEFERAIARATGLEIGGQETVANVLYRFIVSRIAQLSPTAKILLLIGFVLTVFSAVKGLAYLFSWLAILIAYGLYKLLFLFRFFYIAYDKKGREILTLEPQNE